MGVTITKIHGRPICPARTPGRIEAGAMNVDGSLETPALEPALNARQLRRGIPQEFGASPIALAQARRLFLASQLLAGHRAVSTEVPASNRQ